MLTNVQLVQQLSCLMRLCMPYAAVCRAGFGGPQCDLCGGTRANYGPGIRPIGTECVPCPGLKGGGQGGFSFVEPKGTHTFFSPRVIATVAATAPTECVGEYTQVSDKAWNLEPQVSLGGVLGEHKGLPLSSALQDNQGGADSSANEQLAQHICSIYQAGAFATVPVACTHPSEMQLKESEILQPDVSKCANAQRHAQFLLARCCADGGRLGHPCTDLTDFRGMCCPVHA
jgi:hypothetical protein